MLGTNFRAVSRLRSIGRMMSNQPTNSTVNNSSIQTMSTQSSTSSSAPLFSFGLLTDIQYADTEMRLNFTKTEERQYREALRMTRRAVMHWSGLEADQSTSNSKLQPIIKTNDQPIQGTTRHPVSFVVHLGDLIDGLNASLPGLPAHNQPIASSHKLNASPGSQPSNPTATQSPNQSNRALRLVQSVLEGRFLPVKDQQSNQSTHQNPDQLNLQSDTSSNSQLCASNHHPLDKQIIDAHAIANHPRFPVYHVIGNHDLYCGNRSHWIDQFGIHEKRKHHVKHHQPITVNDHSSDQPNSSSNKPVKCMFPLIPPDQYDQSHQTYYAFHPHPSFTCIMLDSYDISTLGHEPFVDPITKQPVVHPHYAIADKLLNERNPNEMKDSPVGLRGFDRRFVRFNGGIGANQLQWLRNCLVECQSNSQTALIFSHIPVHPSTCNAVALLWNYQDVLDLLAQFDCVKLFATGHDHDGGLMKDGSVTHFTAPAVISAPVGRDRFARVDCYENRIDVVGVDLMPSFSIDL